jgi:transposase
LLGDPNEIRAQDPRRQKHDKRDARHILKLLLSGERFPSVWQPSAENEALRQLLLHRCRLVRMRVRIKNQLDGMANNEGLVEGKGWSRRRRKQLESLSLSGWEAQRRSDLFRLHDQLEEQIKPLEQAVEQAADEHAQCGLLRTHPGVGPVVSLAYVLIIGDWQRFGRSRELSSYLGLIPTEDSSGGKHRLGRISKQGNAMLRWLLVQAGTAAQKQDPSWRRQYVRFRRISITASPRWRSPTNEQFGCIGCCAPGRAINRSRSAVRTRGSPLDPVAVFKADNLIGRPASFRKGKSLYKQSWCTTRPNTWLMEPKVAIEK